MNWLIWKEFRLQRLTVAVALFLLIIPYASPCYALWFDLSQPQMWEGACVFSLVLSSLSLALLGGNAIACERADRSAEFQAYLPIFRSHLILAKLLIPAVVALIVWGANTIVLASVARRAELFWSNLAVFAAAAICAFGCAWLVSAVQSSSTFAVAAGLMAPISIAALMGLALWLLDYNPPSKLTVLGGYLTIAISLGLFGLAGGIWSFGNRVEP